MSQGFFKSDGTPVKGLTVYTEDGHNVVIVGDYYYERKDGCRIPIEDGDTSDGLSYPQYTWNLTPPFGPGWMGGVLHDKGYRKGFPKDFMDETLLEILEFLGVSEIVARITYEGVEHGGQSSYDEDVAAWRAKNGY
jgi:hypothetical protein